MLKTERLGKEKKPISINELKALVLEMDPQPTEQRDTRRFELKLPEELAERLHSQAFKGSTTKTAIVIDAIAKHLDKLERR